MTRRKHERLKQKLRVREAMKFLRQNKTALQREMDEFREWFYKKRGGRDD
ncbi:MAG: hypothetical protein ACTSPB_17935 [Candidatus Thorarchaeota archaeon]